MGLFDRLRRRLRPTIDIGPSEWNACFETQPVLLNLEPSEVSRVIAIAERLLARWDFEPCRGATVDVPLRCAITAQAALLVLELGMEWLDAVPGVLVYPSGYRARRREVDELGIVREGYEDLLGEAAPEGPVVLSASEVLSAVDGEAFNLVIHEFAHQLDARSGEADGLPPLHAGMDPVAWRSDFLAAAADLERRESDGEDTVLDPYAAESPAESFAVFSEAFFTVPIELHVEYPRVFEHLREFYRQDPRLRW
ncbi:MAG: zinc-dependent peptidase [Planctomycetota bacterium]